MNLDTQKRIILEKIKDKARDEEWQTDVGTKYFSIRLYEDDFSDIDFKNTVPDSLIELEKENIIKIKSLLSQDVRNYTDAEIQSLIMEGMADGIDSTEYKIPFYEIEINKSQIKDRSDFPENESLDFILKKNGNLERIGSDEVLSFLAGDNKIVSLIKELSIRVGQPVDTLTLTELLDTTPKYIGRMVGNLRTRISQTFEGLSGDDFIPTSRKGDGYRLSDKVNIKIE